MGTMGRVGRCGVGTRSQTPHLREETGGNAAASPAVAASVGILFQGDAHGAGVVNSACRIRPEPMVSQGERAVLQYPAAGESGGIGAFAFKGSLHAGYLFAVRSRDGGC